MRISDWCSDVCSSDLFRAAQLEDVEALDDAAAILATPGLDGAFIGMGDLQLSTGLTADAPELSSKVDRVLELARVSGIPVGPAVQGPAQFRASAEPGYAFIMVGPDVGIPAGQSSPLLRPFTNPQHVL